MFSPDFQKSSPLDKTMLVPVFDVTGTGETSGFSGLAKTIETYIKLYSTGEAIVDPGRVVDASEGIKRVVVVGHGRGGSIFWPDMDDEGGWREHVTGAGLREPEKLAQAISTGSKNQLEHIDLETCNSMADRSALYKALGKKVKVGAYPGKVSFGLEEDERGIKHRLPPRPYPGDPGMQYLSPEIHK